jgi:RNA polymerase sigma-70 factor (ECF subfamily)
MKELPEKLTVSGDARMALMTRTSDTVGTVTSPATGPAADVPGGPSAADPQPTLALLDRARQGDGTAINGLLERHRAAIRRMIDQRMDRVIQRRVDASDIVQDVLLEANRRLGDYLANPTMPFQLWLRHMARDRLIDAHRRHRVASNRSLDREVSMNVAEGQDHSGADLIGQLTDRELTPAAAATWQELERRFAAAVDQLEEDDRKIVLLRHFEHLSTAEAAAALGLSKPAAGMRYLRAMRRLRVLLDGGFDSISIEEAHQRTRPAP